MEQFIKFYKRLLIIFFSVLLPFILIVFSAISSFSPIYRSRIYPIVDFVELPLIIIILSIIVIFSFALFFAPFKFLRSELNKQTKFLLFVPLISIALGIVGWWFIPGSPGSFLSYSDCVSLSQGDSFLGERITERIAQIFQWNSFKENIAYTVFISVAVLITISLIWTIFRYVKTKTRESLLTLLTIISFIAVLVSALSFILIGASGVREKFWDARRISDLKQIQNGLELYYSACEEYPPVSTWQDLSEALQSPKKFGCGVEYIGINQIPIEPNKDHVGACGYQYHNSPDKKSYVLRALLDNPNPTLNDDLDGEIYGLWCGEQNKEIEYCISN